MRFYTFLRMDSTISRLQRDVDSIQKYLTPLLPLANCHMVEFITQNHWENLLPKALSASLDSMTLENAISSFWRTAKDAKSAGDLELVKWIAASQRHCISANNDYCLTRDQLQDRIKAWGGHIKPDIKVKEFMNTKKSYEVQSMCGLVASLHTAVGSSCCVEAGGGRGPLLAALSLAYGVRSLTVDCDEGAVRAAAARAQQMQKQWHAIAKRVSEEPQAVAAPNRGLHRFAAAFVTSRTDLAAIAARHFDTEDVRLLLTGLHTCGNLGPDSLRIFTAQASTAAVFNVPCCYHLLTEDVDAGLFDVFQRDYGDGIQGQAGFPMSQYLRGLNLGRNARMLAAQSIDRVVSLQQLPARSLLFRALLQVIIKKHLPDVALSEGKLKRLSKCETFEDYYKMADTILKLDLIEKVSYQNLAEMNKNMDEQWKRLVLFYFLRLCLAQVIESVILMDRLLYLYEHGFQKCFLVKLFDPVIIIIIINSFNSDYKGPYYKYLTD